MFQSQPTGQQVPLSAFVKVDTSKTAYLLISHQGQFPAVTISFNLATGVALGKVSIAGLSAFSLVFFRYRGRVLIFWLIFITLMLPLEVRIVPTYAVAANVLRPYETLLDLTGISWLMEKATGYRPVLEWGLLNTYTGLILPLIATATGTFLYRQFFLTIPEELSEAARIDGAGPWNTFWTIKLPLLAPTFFFVGITTMIGYFQLFAEPYVMTDGGPLESTKSLVMYMYDEGFRFWRIGFASAIAFVLFVIILAATAIQVRLQRSAQA